MPRSNTPAGFPHFPECPAFSHCFGHTFHLASLTSQRKSGDPKGQHHSRKPPRLHRVIDFSKRLREYEPTLFGRQFSLKRDGLLSHKPEISKLDFIFLNLVLNISKSHVKELITKLQKKPEGNKKGRFCNFKTVL